MARGRSDDQTTETSISLPGAGLKYFMLVVFNPDPWGLLDGFLATQDTVIFQISGFAPYVAENNNHHQDYCRVL